MDNHMNQDEVNELFLNDIRSFLKRQYAKSGQKNSENNDISDNNNDNDADNDGDWNKQESNQCHEEVRMKKRIENLLISNNLSSLERKIIGEANDQLLNLYSHSERFRVEKIRHKKPMNYSSHRFLDVLRCSHYLWSLLPIFNNLLDRIIGNRQSDQIEFNVLKQMYHR